MFNENSSEVVWPNIPIMKANEIVEEENRKLAAAVENIASENRNTATHLQEIELRLSRLESLIREKHSQIFGSSTQMLSNQAVADPLTSSIVNMLKPTLEESVKVMMRTTLIPSLERVCATMFQQMQDTFTKSIKEFTASVESYKDKQRHVQDKGADLIRQMQEIEKQLNVSFSNMQDSEQVKLGFKDQGAIFEDSVISAVQSRAVTPAPHLLDSEAQLAHIQQLLNKGKIVGAFQQALCASDISLVVHVCEKTKPQEVFKVDGSSLLAQPIILLLIQQLSVDLVINTELKLKYIEEAVLNLNPSDIKTNEHMTIVLQELQNNVNNFILSCPTHSCARNMRMLHRYLQLLLSR